LVKKFADFRGYFDPSQGAARRF